MQKQYRSHCNHSHHHEAEEGLHNSMCRLVTTGAEASVEDQPEEAGVPTTQVVQANHNQEEAEAGVTPAPSAVIVLPKQWVMGDHYSKANRRTLTLKELVPIRHW